MSILGTELKRIREEIGLPVNYISEEVGVTAQYIRMLENGKRNNISFHILSKISGIYRVPLDYFDYLQMPQAKTIPLKKLQDWYKQNRNTLIRLIT